MGSIVGGFYAAGYSPDELSSIVQQIDWEAAFRDAPQRRRLSFRKKADDDLPLWPFEIGIGGRDRPTVRPGSRPARASSSSSAG
jgi:hypothetical protein